MAYSDIVSRLERKMDDDNLLNQRHSTIAKYHFVDEAIRWLNNILLCCEKPAYTVLKPHIDIYDLPADFIRVKDIMDLKQCTSTTNVHLTYKESLRQQRKVSGDPSFYQILEREFKFLIDSYPSTSRGAQFYFYDIDTTNQYIHIYSSLTAGSEDFTNWFDGTVIKIENVSGGAIEYIKIGEVSDDIVVVGVDNITMKKVYYTQRDILATGGVTPVQDDLVNLVDLDMTYVFSPDESIFSATISTSGTTLTAFPATLKIGYILVYGTQEKTLIDIDIIDSAFSTNLTNIEVTVIRASDNPPLPLNVQEYIADAAKIFALQNEGRDQEAIIQKQYTESIIAPMQAREMQEVLAKYNGQSDDNPLI